MDVSAQTVRRRLNEHGFKYLDPLKKPLLTKKARTRRLQWAKNNSVRDWNDAIFTDKTTVELFRVLTGCDERKTRNLLSAKSNTF